MNIVYICLYFSYTIYTLASVSTIFCKVLFKKDSFFENTYESCFKYCLLHIFFKNILISYDFVPYLTRSVYTSIFEVRLNLRMIILYRD